MGHVSEVIRCLLLLLLLEDNIRLEDLLLKPLSRIVVVQALILIMVVSDRVFYQLVEDVCRSSIRVSASTLQVEVTLGHLIELAPQAHGSTVGQPITLLNGTTLLLLARLGQHCRLDDLLALHLAEVGVSSLFDLHLFVCHCFTHSPTVSECLQTFVLGDHPTRSSIQ